MRVTGSQDRNFYRIMDSGAKITKGNQTYYIYMDVVRRVRGADGIGVGSVVFTVCGHIQYNEQTIKKKRGSSCWMVLSCQASGNQLARSQSMFSAVSSCQFWNETSLTFLLKPCRSAYFAAASTGSGGFSA